VEAVRSGEATPTELATAVPEDLHGMFSSRHAHLGAKSGLPAQVVRNLSQDFVTDFGVNGDVNGVLAQTHHPDHKGVMAQVDPDLSDNNSAGNFTTELIQGLFSQFEVSLESRIIQEFEMPRARRLGVGHLLVWAQGIAERLELNRTGALVALEHERLVLGCPGAECI